MDNRVRLPDGYRLYGGRIYTIEKYISAGSNSIVYQASYGDTLMPKYTHTVLIKELYPLEPLDRITRDENMELCVAPEAQHFFEYHRESFLLGNQTHLVLSDGGGDHIAENLDSFEANRTLYTVLTSKKGSVLKDMTDQGIVFPTLTTAVDFIKNLLRALQAFHNHRLLHLDISPDNIFLLAPEMEGDFPVEVLLLDFNSVYPLDREVENECQYYLGKPEYMAPEVSLHNRKELGPWTDLYSVCVVFYEILTGEKMPDDRELLETSELVSPYSRLLLHEKEWSAARVNQILYKGLQILPQNRYQKIEEMLADIQGLTDILNGTVKLPWRPEQWERMLSTADSAAQGDRAQRFFTSGRKKAAAALLLLGLASSVAFVWFRPLFLKPSENTVIDVSQFPLVRDDSVVLTQKNVRYPLPENVLKMQVQSSTTVRAALKDYTHPRDLSEVFETYAIWCYYSGAGDKRGMQFADLIYDFFFTEDNTLHMELPLQDKNTFDLEYVGVLFANYNYTEVSVLLDINRCALVDGAGNTYELNELVGSHLLYFDEETYQWNLNTTENQKYVTSFQDIYGGKLIVDAAVGYLDPLLEVHWESDRPDVAEVDDKGNVRAVSQGFATVTATFKDKASGNEKSTQMLVNVTDIP